jgi:hypothetical protein
MLQNVRHTAEWRPQIDIRDSDGTSSALMEPSSETLLAAPPKPRCGQRNNEVLPGLAANLVRLAAIYRQLHTA